MGANKAPHSQVLFFNRSYPFSVRSKSSFGTSSRSSAAPISSPMEVSSDRSSIGSGRSIAASGATQGYGASGTVIGDGGKITAGGKFKYGLFCLSLVICLSSLPLIISLPNGSPLFELYNIVRKLAFGSGFLVLLMGVSYETQLLIDPPMFIDSLVLLSVLSVGSYLLLVVTFGFLLLGARGGLSPTVDSGLATAFAAVLALFYIVVLASGFARRRRGDDARIIRGKDLDSAADLGITVTVGMYAIGLGLQCIAKIEGCVGIQHSCGYESSRRHLLHELRLHTSFLEFREGEIDMAI